MSATGWNERADTEYLPIVGGPHDGQHVCVPYGMNVLHLHEPKPQLADEKISWGEPVPVTEVVSRVTYTRRIFKHKKWAVERHLFAHESLTDDDVREGFALFW